MRGIADTGFIVAAANKTDRYHEWAAEIAARVTDPLLTCEAALSEAAFHVGSVSAVLVFIEDGLLALDFDLQSNLARIRELARSYADRSPDLADLCLIRMSELHPHHVILTTDESDFRVYRRNKREAIPLLCPPHRQ